VSNFTKVQRLELSDLSTKLFGLPNHWQRIHRQQRVPQDTYAKEQQRYVRLKNGQIVTAQTAIARGLLSATMPVKGQDGKPTGETTETPVTQQNTKMIFREATFEELRKAMLTALETKTFSEMVPVQMLLTAAVKFLKGELLNMPYLVVGENGQKDFADLLELVPEDKRAEALKVKVPQGNPNLFCLDGVQFLSDVVFASAQPEKAAEMLETYANGTAEEIQPVQPVGDAPNSDASAAQA
jgi:hypothetical protein